MLASVDTAIATTLREFIRERLQDASARSFFRLEGFREATYREFLSQLQKAGFRLADHALTVRSISPIDSFPTLALEADRSATSYRNNVSVGEALVLILNRRITDAQSLKDLFGVDEQILTRDGLQLLINACFVDYHLSSEEEGELKKFVERLRRLRLEPQLLDLTEFFQELNKQLHASPGLSLSEAIAKSLPFLNLFRCKDLTDQLNTPRGDKLLNMLKRAVQWGSEVREERERTAALERLQKAHLADDSVFGGFGTQTKIDLLRRFIDGALDEQYSDFRDLLKIDWSEVQQVVSPRGQQTKVERYEQLAQELKKLLTGPIPLGDDAADALADLEQGREPKSDDLDALIDELDGALPKQLRRKLQKLVRPRTYSNADFLVGVVSAVIDLVVARQELNGSERIVVKPSRDTLELIEKNKLTDVLDVFWALYGGIERVFPAIDWQLEAMQRQHDEIALDTAEANERQIKDKLEFRVTLQGDGKDVAHAEVVWEYRLDSPASVTVLALDAERARVESSALRIPIYSSVTPMDEINDLDLRLPLSSLGAWYATPADLRDVLWRSLHGTVRQEAWERFVPALNALEQQWAAFVRQSADGLISADVEPLLQAYEEFCASALSHLTTGGEASLSFRHLNQAWMICPPPKGEWVIMPMLHPLKLLWWRERTRFLNNFVQQLMVPTSDTKLVDPKRFQQNLAATYGSSNFPPVVTLSTQLAENAKLFVAVEEAEGYELFVLPDSEAEAYGLDTDLLTEEENRLAAQRAVEGIVGVVQDYIETYPFVRDGIEILLYECRNGAIPGLLIEQLSQASSKRNWRISLNIVVHTSERGAPLFRRVSKWIAGEHAGTERKGLAFFPSITVKVLQCTPEELFSQSEDTDIVILADVLSSYAQTITPKCEPTQESDVPLSGYLPTYRARQEPFQRGERERRLLLNAPQQPRLVRLFLLSQFAAYERHTPPIDYEARFYRDLRLEDEPIRIIEQLHKRFNWVICYDTTIDRFLLAATFPNQVQVIRYSLGLGPKRQHNLTVSSSGHSRRIVERRVASRLGDLFPQAPTEFREQVAKQLVSEANAISGDIVLRAAGPGSFLNELIGLVLAKFETERRFKAQHPNALYTWIMLDDFKHWFSGKFPDLLFVAIEKGDPPIIHMQVLEAKCVGDGSFAREAVDAERQVVQGVDRLSEMFAPGNQHLDALLWYDQLYRAVAGNLEVSPELRGTWEAFRDSLHEGSFKLALQGHTWIFCYDNILANSSEHPFTGPDSMPDIALMAHHYGRNKLAQLLKTLIEAGGQHFDLPSAWDALNSAPIPEPAPTPPPIAPPAVSPLPTRPTSVAIVPIDSTSALPATNGVAVVEPVPPVSQPASKPTVDVEWLSLKARELERVLRQRGVLVYPIDPTEADIGPSIVRFKVRLRPNEVLRKVQSVAEDLARDLALASAPLIDNVARTNFVGIDIPREQAEIIELEPLLARLGTPQIGELPIIVGIAPDGSQCIEDLSEFPHLLVAGATNSGKSVFLRSILLSLMSQYRPGQLELLIIDPKQTDFTFFNGLPYLRGGKVITDSVEARDSLLQLAHEEMPRRQQLIANRSLKVKNFNQRYPDEALPPIVAVIDEYGVLTQMMDKKEREAFEKHLNILAAAARSVSIHLVIATQRPSADVVTSTLKANLDARIAFKVASQTNSRVVLDANGAENLLGRGDLLFRSSGGELARYQAPYMSEEAMMAYLAKFRV